LPHGNHAAACCALGSHHAASVHPTIVLSLRFPTRERRRRVCCARPLYVWPPRPASSRRPCRWPMHPASLA
jgi:hypothetical protein